MQLADLLQDIYFHPKLSEYSIAGLSLDSRQIKPKEVFFAYPGSTADGRRYIADAIANGAGAVIAEADHDQASLQWENNIPIIAIPHLTQRLGLIAARFFDHPGDKLRLIGVTGTNGKTSCTHLIAQALEKFHHRCGIMGTLGSGFYGALNDSSILNTPDALSLHARLHAFHQQKAEAVAMEVSSHGIAQHRIHHLNYDIGIFTNLTQDHLDYHGTMDAYAAVKYHFLAQAQTKQVIINAEDPYGKEWIEALCARKPVFAYSTNKPISHSRNVPLIYTQDAQLSLQHIRASVFTPWGDGEISVPLLGYFNLSNALAVLTTLCVYGVPFADAVASLATLAPVAGRMQTLGGDHQPLVIVDYAHTPDALEKALQAVRAHCTGRLICVFGCGGERDQGKRPLMGRIAEQYADHVIITNDNPRHENPETIAAAILGGMADPESVSVELDRSKAIQKSIQCAKPGDSILIAGKGAEKYQQIGCEKLPFQDQQKVREVLQ